MCGGNWCLSINVHIYEFGTVFCVRVVYYYWGMPMKEQNGNCRPSVIQDVSCLLQVMAKSTAPFAMDLYLVFTWKAMVMESPTMLNMTSFKRTGLSAPSPNDSSHIVLEANFTTGSDFCLV